MLIWLPLLLACSGPDSAPPEPERWWTIAVGERVVGSQWLARGGDGPGATVWLGQHYRWRLDGEAVDRRVRVRAERDGQGRVVALDRSDSDGQRSWAGEPAAWLELAALDGDLRPGMHRALDLDGLTVREVAVAPVEDGLVWSVDGVRTVARAGGRFSWGGLHAEPVDAEPVLEAVDPTTLFRRSVRSVDDPRSVHRVDWRVGEEARTTTRPLDIEVPRATRGLLTGWVRDVRRGLTHAPTPGSPDALLALQRGTGDCNEFAAVLVARAASDGFEARPVAGLVYLDGDRGPTLELHAWAEVDLGEPLGWVAVDPALDQPLADATHLPLARGQGIQAAVAVLAQGEPIELVSVR